MTQIINPKLRELDEKVGDFYKLSARYFGSLVNLHGREIYKEGLANLLQEADGVNPEGRFDKLVLDNIQSNLRLNDMVIDYFADPNFAIPVKDFFNRLAGRRNF
jgi:hypothetical protein